MTMRVRTASRLHFGLLSVPHMDGVDMDRAWGGAGLMIEQLGIELHAQPAATWQADGPSAERVVHFARTFAKALGETLPPMSFTVVRCAPEHYGLGTGTQLALAVARLLADSSTPTTTLADYTRRGKRSFIGIHGFEHGGFLVEAGKRPGQKISPLIARVAFPSAWRIVLLLPLRSRGLHGQRESQAFDDLQQVDSPTSRRDELCRLVMLGMLPALAETDLPAFGQAVYAFNRKVGEGFRRVQGGIYSHTGSEDMVLYLRTLGLTAVGQSSWGPALFAVAADEEHAEYVSEKVRERFSLTAEEVCVTQAANHGAVIETNP